MRIPIHFILCFCFTLAVHASSVDTLVVFSKTMNKEVKNVVITPDSYAEVGKPYSVLYLLHGASGNHRDWLKKVPGIKKYADAYNVIIVCPDGSKTSWYFDSPIDPKMQYETYLSKELVAEMDKKYNTRAAKKGRAITGLSMGGHGAFYLAFKHSNIWGAAGSMSGGVDFRPFPNNWDIAERLGKYAENKEVWETNTVINMVHLITDKSLKLVFECGVDDFFYDGNKRLHEKLLERNIPHDYTERPGRHDWNYWGNALKYQMLFFDDFFNE